MMTLNGLIRTIVVGAVTAGAGAMIATSQGTAGNDLAASLRKQVGLCWLGVGDLGPDGKLEGLVYARLNRDGSLASPAELKSPVPGTALSPDAAIAVERAVAAVNKCAPYALPEDKFDWWDEVEIVFAPPVPQMIS